MAEFGNLNDQTINPGESAVFTVTIVSPESDNIRHSDGTSSFILRGINTCGRRNRCRCCRKRFSNFLASFGANIAVPEGQTVGEISVALVIDGATLPGSIMRVTPAAVGEFENISRVINVPIWLGCCQTISVRNTSSIPITMDAPNLVLKEPEGN